MSGAGTRSHTWPCSGWGLPSRPGHPGRWCALTAPFHPCLCPIRANPGRAIGGLFSVALSVRSPCLAVSQHPSLRSPDLPRPGHPLGAEPRPPGRLTIGVSVVAPSATPADPASPPHRIARAVDRVDGVRPAEPARPLEATCVGATRSTTNEPERTTQADDDGISTHHILRRGRPASRRRGAFTWSMASPPQRSL